MTDPRWDDRAACRDSWLGDAWLDARGPARREAAIWVCRTACPLLGQCREWSLTLPISTTGIIGGLLPGERRADRTRRRESPAWAYPGPRSTARPPPSERFLYC